MKKGTDYTGELVAWLARALESSPPPPGIVAYYVGLFESPDGCTAYLIGSRVFDPDDDEWACNDDYAPAEKYFPLPEKITGPRDYRRVERRVVRAVKTFLAAPENGGSSLVSAEAVAVGFDDGDLTRVK